MINIAKLKIAAEKATPGPWDVDSIENDGTYGNGEDDHKGFKSYAVCAGIGFSKSIVDTSNSDVAMVEYDYADDTGGCAWDEVGRRNAKYIAAANPLAILSLISRLERAEAHGRNQGLDEAVKRVKIVLDSIKNEMLLPEHKNRSVQSILEDTARLLDRIFAAILALKTTEGET